MRPRSEVTITRSFLIRLVVVSCAVVTTIGAVEIPAGGFDIDAENRRDPIPGLYDWSRAGYRGGAQPPTQAAIVLQAVDHGVVAGDGGDDSAALQAVIDDAASHNRGYGNPVVIELPAGRIDIGRQIAIDVDHVVIRGAGSGGDGTLIVFRPDADTRYDVITGDGSEPDFDAMRAGSGKGGWIWPGRGLFRVQTRAVHPDYQSDWENAPLNRKDLLEGTVNSHWKAGLIVDQSRAFAARAGDTVIPIDASDANGLSGVAVGDAVVVRAADSEQWYRDQGVSENHFRNGHMRMQMYTVTAVGAASISIDKPLEFDLPANSTSDGSSAIDGTLRESKVVPLDIVEGVGFEDLAITLDLTGLPRHDGGTYDLTAADALGTYLNLAPDYALHGVIFKWARNCWMRRVRTEMTGSHPVVSEEARHLQIEHCHFEGSWNKGAGGNGYLRGSRLWDSIIHHNTLLALRHLTMQWSASGNVVIGNTVDCDFNLHGGWERHNLFELNVVHVPEHHGPSPGTTWYPIWWGAGPKAGKWAGATGPQNVFHRNDMRKQTSPAGPFLDYAPYFADDGSLEDVVFQFGWDRDSVNGSRFQHLLLDGSMLDDWTGEETTDFSAPPHAGVNAEMTDTTGSLFLAAPGLVLDLVAQPTSGDLPLSVAFDAGGSRWPDGVTPIIDWTFGDGTSLADGGVEVSHIYTDPGVFTATCTLRDGVGNAVERSLVITVSDPTNTAPTAAITVDVERGEAPLSVAFDGGGSQDPDGDPLTYTWNFAGDATATGATASHTFQDAGSHLVTLTIADGRGGSDSASRTITVEAAVDLEVRYAAANTDPVDNKAVMELTLHNLGPESVDLSQVTLRYWFRGEGALHNAYTDFLANLAAGDITTAIRQLPADQGGADAYLELGFTAAAGSLAPAADSGVMKLRIARDDWADLDESDDWSFAPSFTDTTAHSRVTAYLAGALVWGDEPGGTTAERAIRMTLPPAPWSWTITPAASESGIDGDQQVFEGLDRDGDHVLAPGVDG